jgi:hypothetical protein
VVGGTVATALRGPCQEDGAAATALAGDDVPLR